MANTENEVLDFMDELVEMNPDLKKYQEEKGALSEFFNDYDFLKSLGGLTQNDIAEALGTRQSAVSRLESTDSNPSYKTLWKLAKAVGGNLLVTPMGDMTVTVPVDLQEEVKDKASAMHFSVHDYLAQIIRKGITDNIIYDMTDSKVMEMPISAIPPMRNGRQASISIEGCGQLFDDMAC